MATMQDFEILEAINSAKNEAKRSGKNIPVALSGGKEYYRKSIKSIIGSGKWTVTTSIYAVALSCVINLIDVIKLSQDYVIDWAYVVGYFVGILLVAAIPIFFGAKLIKFNSTPTFTLVALIITLICNILLMAGVLPLISIILNIIAITRWSTYKDWFYKIDPKRSR